MMAFPLQIGYRLYSGAFPQESHMVRIFLSSSFQTNVSVKHSSGLENTP
jgi:hypothetical protein